MSLKRTMLAVAAVGAVTAVHAVPAMALVDVAIRREGVHAELLEANIKFNLYLSEGKK